MSEPKSGFNLPPGCFERDLPGANDKPLSDKEECQRDKDTALLGQMHDKLLEVYRLWEQLSDEAAETLDGTFNEDVEHLQFDCNATAEVL